MGSEVVKLLIENDRATGVRLRNGSEIKAKSLVVINLSALQSIRLIGEEHLDTNIVRRVKNIRHDRHNVVWGMIALHELPQYKAASFNPDCGKQPRLYIGPRNADYVANEYPAEIINNGIAKRAYMFVGPDSIWDRSRAPEGKHIIGFEEFSAPARFFSPAKWQALRNEFEDATIEDACYFDLDKLVDNILTTRSVFVPGNSTPPLEEAFRKSDLIIAKGVFNFESLAGDNPLKPIIYMLKMKCRLLCEINEAEMGNAIVRLENS